MGCLSSKQVDSPQETITPQKGNANGKPANGDTSTQPANGEDVQKKELHQLVRPDKYKENRPTFYAAYARAARRYGFEAGKYAGFAKRGNVVVKVRGQADKSTDHEVPATSVQNGDSEYVVPVTVGTPGVTVQLDFDTGSSDLWVWSSELANAKRFRQEHRIYNPEKSSTAKHTSGHWEISYGDGSSASGDVWTDAVTVAGVKIPNQAVEAAKELSESFLEDGGSDGLLGLAWPSINTVNPEQVATPVENMIEQGLITLPLFTVKLGHGTKEKSFYSFGYIDPTVTSHPFSYTPVDNSNGFWQVPSTSYTINGTTYNRPNNTTILDTGTTLLLVADDVVEAIYESIDGAVYDDEQGGWKYPSNAQVPDVSFAVGDQLYKLNAVDFGFGDAGDGYTFGGIQSRGDMDMDIYGDVFLKCVYAVFNQGESIVGLAQRDD